MSGTRPGVLRIGDRVRLDGAALTVVGLAGTLVHLADERGAASVMRLPELLLRAEVAGGSPPAASRLPSTRLARVAPEAAEAAAWWEPHIIEVITGRPPGAEPGARPAVLYDPATRTLAEREEAKAAELAAAGHTGVSVGTVRRKRLRYQAQGLSGLLDGRADRTRRPTGRADARVVDALRRAVDEAEEGSSRSVEFLRWRVRRLLDAEHGRDAVPLPSRATFYRLVDAVGAGRHVTGSARTRRSLANRPDGPFGQVAPVRPGELMQIDSTPLDVLVRLGNGAPGRVDLTAVIDVATRTVTAAVLRPTTKAVDASLLLARTVTPEPMRPGWVDALRMERSVLPFEHLHGIDERLAHAAARPVITPETIVCDHGMVFVSENFRSSCAWLGIDFQPGHLGTPTDKPHVERMIETVGTMFCQYVSGYLGSSVERRGRRVDEEPLWSWMELQALLDEWVVAAWQNRPHDGLRDPAAPGRRFTPNEKYAALVQAAGYVPVALSGQDYIELLPARWRAINAYGVKIDHRTYDAEELNPLRRQRSGVAAKRDLWEAHHDPYDVTRIWIRNHWDGGWITLFWKHLTTAPAPFGELAWDHALGRPRADGVPDPTEAEIAAAAGALLERAHRGPERDDEPPRGQRRAAPATSTATPQPAAAPPPGAAPAEQPDRGGNGDDPPADVVPLAVFDAHEEAKRWW